MGKQTGAGWQFHIIECKKKCAIKTGIDMEDLNKLQSKLLSEISQPKSPHTVWFHYMMFWKRQNYGVIKR